MYNIDFEKFVTQEVVVSPTFLGWSEGKTTTNLTVDIRGTTLRTGPFSFKHVLFLISGIDVTLKSAIQIVWGTAYVVFGLAVKQFVINLRNF
jgi:hypothetical protein